MSSAPPPDLSRCQVSSMMPTLAAPESCTIFAVAGKLARLVSGMNSSESCSPWRPARSPSPAIACAMSRGATGLPR